MVTVKLPNGTVVEGTVQEIAEVLRSMGSGDAALSAQGTATVRQPLRCYQCGNEVKVFLATGWGHCEKCSRYIEPPGTVLKNIPSGCSSDPIFNCGTDKNGFVRNDLGIRQEYPGGPMVFG